MPDDITIAIPTAEDWAAIHQVASMAFNNDSDDVSRKVQQSTFEPARSLVARRDDEIVGTAGLLTRRLAVPGAVIPGGHVSMVTVAPTARRQGVASRFMRQQFADMRAAGESVGLLWASEGRIYQRFGYGLACRRLSLQIDTREVRLSTPPPVGGRMRSGSPDEMRDALVKVYDQVYPHRPGWSERSARNWDQRLTDLESERRGASARRAVVYEVDGTVEGYALWRVTNNWDDAGPAGEVKVMEQVTTTPGAYAAIWNFLLTMDLTRTTSFWTCALDEPLQFMVNEPRRLGARLVDALWVRITDLPVALAARRYPTAVDVVLEITDDLIEENAGRWRLVGSPDAAECTPTTADADLRCDVRALGATYLGGTPLSALASGGLIEEIRPGALNRANTALGWHRAPSAIEVF